MIRRMTGQNRVWHMLTFDNAPLCEPNQISYRWRPEAGATITCNHCRALLAKKVRRLLREWNIREDTTQDMA